MGILGFIPGVTTHYGSMEFAAHHSGAKLLNIFQVSVLHNIVHLLFGIAGLALARAIPTARNYLVVGGAVYLVLWLYGLIIDVRSNANFAPVNNADNWLHFFLGIGMIGAGFFLTRTTSGVGTTRSRTHSAAGVPGRLCGDAGRPAQHWAACVSVHRRPR